MQPRTSRLPLQNPVAHGTDDDPRLAAELSAALAAARRRAVRDGDRQIDTAHLLHSLLEQDPQVRTVLGGGPQLARLLGYLVQRSIGYGLRWQSGVEHAGDAGSLLPVGLVGAVGAVGAVGDGLSPLAAEALEHACVRAERRGARTAGGVDLLAAIVAEPGARAVEVLDHAAVDIPELRARIDDGTEGASAFTG
ncbi:Clp protease N-terminal domain-containing protein [Streptomyces asoensis]|uniref:Clp protease N-terminal domain-containing protein n=1 Tax=Streptomyces asoensis TaxID=249586 RepID=UPI00332D5527